MALNKRRVTRSRQTSSTVGGQFGRLEDGRNIIRVFTFHHKVAELDFEMGFYGRADGYKVGDEFDEIERASSVHFLEEGMVNCLGRGCAHCAEAQKYLDSKDKRDKKTGKQLSARRRFYVNAVNMNESEREMQIFALPTTVFNEVISYVDDPEYGETVLGAEGRDFIIERDSKADPANMYSVKLRDAKNSEMLTSELQDSAQDLFRCQALDPGWSSKSELNTSEGKRESDSETVDRARSSAGRRARREQYRDEGEGDSERERPQPATDDGQGDLPWEKQEIKVGDTVSFKEGKNSFEGPVKEINDGVAVIEADDSLWDIPVTECKRVEAPKPAARRRRA